MRSLGYLLWLATTVAGCASANMTSMAAPDVKGHTYARVLVFADIDDLGQRQEAENSLTAVSVNGVANGDMLCDPICRVPGLTTALTKFVPAYTVFFPGRQYSLDDIATVLRREQIDATLVVSPTTVGVETVYIPPSYLTTCSATAGATSCGTNPVGGGTLAKPWEKFAAKLFDVADGRVVWVATSTASGTAFASRSDLIRSMAALTREKLLKDGVVR